MDRKKVKLSETVMKQKIIDFTNKDCCLNCHGFCFWDGDYCCIKKMKIHQYGYGNENGGYGAYTFMNEDIDNTMETPETCKDYSFDDNKEYIEEYKKFKEWDRLCKQLEAHTKKIKI